MTRRSVRWLALSCCGLAGDAALAQSGIPLPKSGIACYARDYDASHMSRNPRQQVERIRFVITNSIASAKGDFPYTWFRGVIAYAARGRAGETWQSVACDETPDSPADPITCNARCYDNTSAEFRVASEGKDALRIDLSGEGVPLCFDDDALAGKENRVFVLRRVAPEKCSLTKR